MRAKGFLAIIIIHFRQTLAEYARARGCPGRDQALPASCPQPDCQVVGRMVYWGRYTRTALTGVMIYVLLIQRVRCQACGHTQALLPDFLHPHRRYVLSVMQQVVALYLWSGLGFGQLLKRLPGDGPAAETVREWLTAFGYGAGYLLWGRLQRFVAGLAPLATATPTETPPALGRSRQADLLARGVQLWQWGEQLYAHSKAVVVQLDYQAGLLFPYMLHWLQQHGLPPRLFWSPRLKGTPRVPY